MDEPTRLALAARDGDRVALAAFVRSTQAEVWRFCAHLGDRDRADDVTQDVYLRVLRALPAFRAESGVRTWLLGIARRAVADDIRRQRRRRGLTERLSPKPPAADPAGEVATGALVAGLDDERRAAFVLTQLLGLSYAEAAEVCGCPVGTIRSRVARAREELAGGMEEAAAT
jgi:RNA polymerase sigma-70 factor, ECF subfamily